MAFGQALVLRAHPGVLWYVVPTSYVWWACLGVRRGNKNTSILKLNAMPPSHLFCASCVVAVCLPFTGVKGDWAAFA